MFHTKVGEILSRISPPFNEFEGSCQTGVVTEVTDTEIVVDVQVDVVRRMHFFRRDGRDTLNMGTFLVRPDFLAETN